MIGSIQRGLAAASLAVVLTGCIDNTAPGNDRESQLDPPPTAATLVSAGQAIAGVDPGILMPDILTDADLRQVPGDSRGCIFRMTRVGLPIFLYAPSGPGTMKMNGHLFILPREGQGWGADGVQVTVRMLDGEASAELSPAEYVVRLPGMAEELGFHGYTQCGGAA